MRYEVAIKMELYHLLAIEADSVFEAQTKALAALGEHDAERMEVHIDVERGTR